MTVEIPPGWSLPSDLAAAWRAALHRAGDERWVERLWARDATLWTNGDESRWLGWLDAPERERGDVDTIERFAAAVAAEGIGDVLLLGMGGSSLAPEVLAALQDRPRFAILDSTDPAQVATAEARLDGQPGALFIVASKSGSTLEPNVLFDYFWERQRRPGRRFVAITDPGSRLEALAGERGLRAVFHGEPSIGGRYSALSKFGLLPAALLGVDVRRFLERAGAMAAACRREGGANPGLVLGLLLGVAARAGRDKLTLVPSARFAAVGSWLEQLVAESTGKNGRAIIPIDGEELSGPGAYGADRVFVALAPSSDQDRALTALEHAGHPVLRLDLEDALAFAAETFRWEAATAFAGAALGINPFDQPDVEASKIETRKLTDAYESAGRLPDDEPATAPDDEAALRAHFAALRPGDYAAFLAYIERHDRHHAALQRLRQAVRDGRRVATCVGFGPRFLHSTGQAYKGGPNTGVFLQITCDDPHDLPIPGRRASFGVIKAAQARGDLEVLRARGRRVLRVHLGADVAAGLERLAQSIAAALA